MVLGFAKGGPRRCGTVKHNLVVCRSFGWGILSSARYTPATFTRWDTRPSSWQGQTTGGTVRSRPHIESTAGCCSIMHLDASTPLQEAPIYVVPRRPLCVIFCFHVAESLITWYPRKPLKLLAHELIGCQGVTGHRTLPLRTSFTPMRHGVQDLKFTERLWCSMILCTVLLILSGPCTDLYVQSCLIQAIAAHPQCLPPRTDLLAANHICKLVLGACRALLKFPTLQDPFPLHSTDRTPP